PASFRFKRRHLLRRRRNPETSRPRPTPRNRIRNPFCGKDVLKLLRCHSLAVQPAAVRGMSAVTSTENRSMKGKTIVATGATSGIGEAAVLELAGMGARVVAIARHQRRAQATMRKLEAKAPGLGHR